MYSPGRGINCFNAICNRRLSTLGDAGQIFAELGTNLRISRQGVQIANVYPRVLAGRRSGSSLWGPDANQHLVVVSIWHQHLGTLQRA